MKTTVALQTFERVQWIPRCPQTTLQELLAQVMSMNVCVCGRTQREKSLLD